MPLVVRDMRQFHAALAQADRDVRLGVRKVEREVAEPVRRDAALLAGTAIRNMGVGDPWSQMRTGVTRRLVYVAPHQRGAKTGPRKRPNLARLLEQRAMRPAEERNRTVTRQRYEAMLDQMAARFNRSPV